MSTEFLEIGFCGVVGASSSVARTHTDRPVAHFYATHFNFEGEPARDPAAALRAAQLAIRREMHAPGGLLGLVDAAPESRDAPLPPDEPFWWAGFRLVGM